ncbi:copper resistance protein CopC [Streptomyces sp. NPDC057137]|uniref:copper resistance CopC family protein n=1 Tax=Streptomyces sp. NPDC057137 TaxID=3346030 RepID=UPI003633B318
MHAVNRRAARAAARCLVVPLSVALPWFAAQPAFAHTELVSGSPAEAASESRLPRHIKLTFSDEMTSRYAKVALTAPDGEQGAAGAPQVTGRTVTLPVKPGLPAGSYTVGYRVVSADGHPVAGSYRFTVEEEEERKEEEGGTEAAAGSPTPAPRSVPDPSQAGDATPSGAEETSSGVPAMVAAGGLLLLGAAAVSVAVIRRRRVRHGS